MIISGKKIDTLVETQLNPMWTLLFITQHVELDITPWY
jgi:hypothetical protein